MNRKFSLRGLILIASMALTAVMASTASAQFTSTSAHTILSGAQSGSAVFTAGEGFGSIKCTTSTLSGTSSSTNAADVTLTPTISGCSDSFGRTVHVDNNLTYTFTKTGTSGGTPTGTAHLSGSYTLTTTNSVGVVVCTVHIVTPQAVQSSSYHNAAGGVLTYTLNWRVKNTTTGSFFNCGVSEGEHTEGTYVGTFTISGVDTAGKAVTLAVD